MRTRKSTLYQLDNAMAELNFAILRAIDEESWKSPEQFMVTVNSSITDIRREFENRYGKFTYPSMVTVRNPEIDIQPHNNINNNTQEITQDNQIIQVRPITLSYEMVIIDYRKQYIDEYYESLLMNLYRYSPRIDVKCVIGKDADGNDYYAHNLASVSYDVSTVTISLTPTYDDKTTNNGQIYVLKVPFTVDTQLLGNYQEAKLIYNMIVNYLGMTETDGVYEFVERDEFSTVPKDLEINEKGN